MISLESLKVFSYVSCISKSLGLDPKDPLVIAEALIIAYRNKDPLDIFIANDYEIKLKEYREVNGNLCDPYLKVFSKYDRNSVIGLAKKLVLKHKVNDEEEKLLKEIESVK